MDKGFLREPEFNKQNLLNVLSAHNYDGTKAHDDILKIQREDKKRTLSRRFAPVAASATLFSLYNVARIGQLSPSGQPAAIVGTFFFAYLTYTSLERGQALNFRLFAQQEQTPENASQQATEQKTEGH